MTGSWQKDKGRRKMYYLEVGIEVMDLMTAVGGRTGASQRT